MKKKMFLVIALMFAIYSYGQKVGLEIGNIAPEIKLSSPSGEVIALSSLRGKLVLIDFWASWCGPCRKENPNLVATYNNYKNSKFINGNGFTIYAVSADKDKKQWETAIEKDNLTWTHVSDLKYWQSEVLAIYGIRSIPSNVLIDKDGKILEKNLRGESLSIALEKYLKKDPKKTSKEALENFEYEINDLSNSTKLSKKDLEYIEKIKVKISEIEKIIEKISE